MGNGGTQPPRWVKDAVFYQVFPDRFRRGSPASGRPALRPWGEPPDRDSLYGGDLAGIPEKLDYLDDLGVTALYLTPIFTSPSNHRYDTVDYFHVDPALGGNGALRELVAAAHARGMRIILDGVFNHCSDQHPFFRSASERGRESPYWDWFTIEGGRVRKEPEPNYACWAGVTAMPEWNHENPEVREYLLAVVRHWIREFDIDGWRLDTVEWLPPDFVRGVYHAAKEEKPDAYVLGEVMGIATSWFKYGALDGVMHYKLREALVRFIAEERDDAVDFSAAVRSLWYSYPRENGFASYTLVGSHDTPRFLTLAGRDRGKLLSAYAFLFSFPGAPAIYYGDEIGLEGGEDPDCRRPFPWDGEWDRELLSDLKWLIAIRRARPALREGEPRFLAAKGRALILSRRTPYEEVLLALNAGRSEARLPLPRGRWRDLWEEERAEGYAIIPPGGFRLYGRTG